MYPTLFEITKSSISHLRYQKLALDKHVICTSKAKRRAVISYTSFIVNVHLKHLTLHNVEVKVWDGRDSRYGSRAFTAIRKMKDDDMLAFTGNAHSFTNKEGTTIAYSVVPGSIFINRKRL